MRPRAGLLRRQLGAHAAAHRGGNGGAEKLCRLPTVGGDSGDYAVEFPVLAGGALRRARDCRRQCGCAEACTQHAHLCGDAERRLRSGRQRGEPAVQPLRRGGDDSRHHSPPCDCGGHLHGQHARGARSGARCGRGAQKVRAGAGRQRRSNHPARREARPRRRPVRLRTLPKHGTKLHRHEAVHRRLAGVRRVRAAVHRAEPRAAHGRPDGRGDGAWPAGARRPARQPAPPSAGEHRVGRGSASWRDDPRRQGLLLPADRADQHLAPDACVDGGDLRSRRADYALSTAATRRCKSPTPRATGWARRCSPRTCGSARTSHRSPT
jgi:hypothetical protein